jgi:hypothetical protein
MLFYFFVFFSYQVDDSWYEQNIFDQFIKFTIKQFDQIIYDFSKKNLLIFYLK